MTQHLRLVDGDGQVVGEGQCERCRALEKELEYADKRLGLAQRQLAREKEEKNKRRSMSAFADPANQVYERWRARCRPGAKEFGPERFDAVVERLVAGYSVQDCYMAIEGARLVIDRETDFKPTGTQTYTDLKNIAKSAQAMDRFMGYVDEVKEKRRDARRELRRAWTAAVEIGGGVTETQTGPCLACGEANAKLVEDTFICVNGCDHEAQVDKLRSWWRDVYRGAA